MAKKTWERDNFLLMGDCANKSKCNVRENNAALKKVEANLRNVD